MKAEVESLKEKVKREQIEYEEKLRKLEVEKNNILKEADEK